MATPVRAGSTAQPDGCSPVLSDCNTRCAGCASPPRVPPPMLRSLVAPLALALAAGCASSGGPGSRPAAPPRPEASRAYDARFPDPGTPLAVQVVSTADR